jgi:MinD superfamily P-loop ATPase
MTRIDFERLVELVEGDRELVKLLIREQIVIEGEGGFGVEDVDVALASRTLVRDLDVNVPGVEIILRLRRALAEARARIAELEEKGD